MKLNLKDKSLGMGIGQRLDISLERATELSDNMKEKFESMGINSYFSSQPFDVLDFFEYVGTIVNNLEEYTYCLTLTLKSTQTYMKQPES